MYKGILMGNPCNYWDTFKTERMGGKY